MKDYPFVKCLHPKQIVNPYTGEEMFVPCGSCEACVLSKCSKDTLKCQLESLSHRYCYFVTLTYNQQSLPRCTLVASDDHLGHYVVSVCERLEESGEVIGFVKTSPYDIGVLSRKCNLGYNSFGYLSKYDVQLFLKRLRKLFKDEKLRYYAVGEYGPVHYRPHFHFLLWFEEPWYATQIEFLVRQAWPFGRVDVSLSEGGCAQYTSGYVNSYCNLPEVFGLSKIKPFKTHSFFLGEKFLSCSREEVYKMPYRDFVTRCIPIAGRLTNVHLWRSLKTTFFPKCKGFSSLPASLRMFSYRIYLPAFRYTGVSSAYKSARIIAETLKTLNDYFVFPVHPESYVFKAVYSPNPSFDKMLNFIHYSVDSTAFCYQDDTRLVSQIYNILRVSFHFLMFVCYGDTSYETSRTKLKMIEQFYDEEKKEALRNHFEMLEDMDEDLFVSGDYRFFYNNVVFDVEELQNTSIYLTYAQDVLQRYSDSIKHKRLNDANKIFENI